ncbi:hypothetical protein O9993_16685 [Vibrio lentus]|nr:hypothetical protein [Vibrio lentus]
MKWSTYIVISNKRHRIFANDVEADRQVRLYRDRASRWARLPCILSGKLEVMKAAVRVLNYGSFNYGAWMNDINPKSRFSA